MIAINPENIKIVCIGNKERKALLNNSFAFDDEILRKIRESKTKLTLFNFEFENFLGALGHTIDNIDISQNRKILTKLYNRLIQVFEFNHNLEDSIEDYLDNEDIDELESAMTLKADKHNSTPDYELGGLSPTQVYNLIYSKWDDEKCPIKFNKNLTIDDLKHSTFFYNTRLFLNQLLEHENKDIATVRGNLNRRFVSLMFEKMQLDDDYRKTTKKYNKVLNEADVFELHIIKIICELAGIIRRRKKKILVIKKHQKLLSEENAGKLYYLLFETYFRKFNLEYSDRLPEVDGLQQTISFTLYMIGKHCRSYRTPWQLLSKIFLPAVMENIERKKITLQRKNMVYGNENNQPS
jgi:hypothetical protein